MACVCLFDAYLFIYVVPKHGVSLNGEGASAFVVLSHSYAHPSLDAFQVGFLTVFVVVVIYYVVIYARVHTLLLEGAVLLVLIQPFSVFVLVEEVSRRLKESSLFF